MRRSRYFMVCVFLLLIATAIWSAGRGGTPSIVAQETQKESQGESSHKARDALKTPIPPEGPERAAALARIEEERLLRFSEQVEETRKTGLQSVGSNFAPSVAPESAEHEKQRLIADLLSAHMAVPEARLRSFEWIESRLGHRIIGWRGTILSVIDEKGYTTIRLAVTPVLATSGGRRTVFTTRSTIETWVLDTRGKLTLKESKPYSMLLDAVFVD